MKNAKEDGNVVKLIKDKLFINGQRYRGPHIVHEEPMVYHFKLSRLPKHHDFSNIFIIRKIIIHKLNRYATRESVL